MHPGRSRLGRLLQRSQHLLGVVLAAVKAAIDVLLDAAVQGVEQGGDDQGGDDNNDGRTLQASQAQSLAGERPEDLLKHDDFARG